MEQLRYRLRKKKNREGGKDSQKGYTSHRFVPKGVIPFIGRRKKRERLECMNHEMRRESGGEGGGD